MQQPQTVLVTGGAGYVGCVLVPKLLSRGHRVKVLDLYIYGEGTTGAVDPNGNLQHIKGDIRDIDLVKWSLSDCDTVIHLACISNDPSCELDPQLTRSINYDAFLPIVESCKSAGVKRFIFASSSSVYGISDQPNVAEDHPRLPVTDYNRYKAMCEDVLIEHDSADFATVIIRPATVCGYSPRLRLDLTVNILTNHAFNKGKITVFGGSQYRPNLHIDDMTDLYIRLVEEADDRVAGKVYNAGYQNQTVMGIAETVKATVLQEYPAKEWLEIATSDTDDVRSYRITSEKIGKELGFFPKRTIEDAVRDLCRAFQAGKVPEPLTNSDYFNVSKMKEIGLK